MAVEYLGSGNDDGVVLGRSASDKVGFYGAAPVDRPAALTAALTALTHTAPGTPDYAVQDLTQTSPFGFVTKDEGNTVLSVIVRTAARVAELEARLEELGLITGN